MCINIISSILLRFVNIMGKKITYYCINIINKKYLIIKYSNNMIYN